MAPKKSKVVSETPVVAIPEPAPVVVVEPEVEAVPVTTVDTQSSVDKFTSVLDTLQSLQNQLKDVVVIVKGLHKDYVKLQKQKGGKKARKVADDGTGPKRPPSGFAKPTSLSDELCDFLSIPHGSSLARTEVTRVINDYIKKNELQNASDRRKIIPDAHLKSILKYDETKGLSYFSLQSSIKHHFQKI
jgi:chromatin remodeling complex protein RSC6